MPQPTNQIHRQFFSKNHPIRHKDVHARGYFYDVHRRRLSNYNRCTYKVTADKIVVTLSETRILGT